MSGFKLWWGIFWRMYFLIGLLAFPFAVLYALLADLFLETVFAFKMKQTFLYIFIALSIYLISKNKSLTHFYWKNVAPSSRNIEWINKSLLVVCLFSSVMNMLFALLASTDAFVAAKLLINSFVLFTTPIVLSIGIKFQYSKYGSELYNEK